MSRPDLQALLAEWTPILRLQDWRVNASYVGSVGVDGAVAVCNPLWDYLDASIQIVDPNVIQHDVEETLVHELLHLHFAGFDTLSGTWERSLEERAVESITRGVLNLKRAGVAPAVRAASARKTITSARARIIGKERHRMDAKRYGEIMMELGGMADLPDAAKPLIAELASMAVSDGAPDVDAPPMAASTDATDKPGTPMFKLNSEALSLRAKRVQVEKSLTCDALREKARKVLGARCTPAVEKELSGMTEPEQIEGALRLLTASAPPPAAKPPTGPSAPPAGSTDAPPATKGPYTAALARARQVST